MKSQMLFLALTLFSTAPVLATDLKCEVLEMAAKDGDITASYTIQRSSEAGIGITVFEFARSLRDTVSIQPSAHPDGEMQIRLVINGSKKNGYQTLVIAEKANSIRYEGPVGKGWFRIQCERN